MTRHTDVDRTLESWLAEGPSQLPDHVVDGIVRQLDQTNQRKLTWLPGRQRMNRMILAMGGIAAAVAVILVGAGLFLAMNAGAPGVGGPSRPTPAPTPTGTLLAPREPTPRETSYLQQAWHDLGVSEWQDYSSSQYKFSVSYPPDWTVYKQATRSWVAGTDTLSVGSSAMDQFVDPTNELLVGAFVVPVEPPATIESNDELEAWAKEFCQGVGQAECDGVADRAIPMCSVDMTYYLFPEGRRLECHPAVIVPYADEVHAYFIGEVGSADSDGSGDRVTVVVVGRPENHPSVAQYGGAKRLLEAFVSTMGVLTPPTATP